ncbi:TIGR00255 family protein [Bacteroidales bacterium WCE2004]|nr:TIGR00255 family protein [Bacteroidales bacterium WCE2004]
MIKSMTGYGKGIAELSTGRLTLEIRTLNGKNCDINIKSSLLPKDKELEVRKTLTDALQRGTVDLLLTFEPKAGAAARKIDAAMVEDYFRQIHAIGCKVGIAMPKEEYLEAILRFPDVFEGGKQETIPEEEWPAVQAALQDALTALDAYRVREGAALYADVTSRVAGILALYDEVEAHEAERLDAVRERIRKAAEDLQVKLDKERFEQEMIFYLEKLDINEEKVRLRQHCKYFMDTIDGEPYPGKKLGFIIQEMGREINTTGSKANHAPIQQLVVRMKDELEKIREQSMNIL